LRLGTGNDLPFWSANISRGCSMPSYACFGVSR
jgi:hypothetical protein